MSAFDKYFSEPQLFNNGEYVISGQYDRVDAALKIGYAIDEIVNPENLRSERVRFGYAPEFVDEHTELGACWYTGASGKGSKAVWVF